jgi:hypothetical protein
MTGYMNVRNSGTHIVAVHMRFSITEGDKRRELLGPDVLSFELRSSSLSLSLSVSLYLVASVLMV